MHKKCHNYTYEYNYGIGLLLKSKTIYAIMNMIIPIM